MTDSTTWPAWLRPTNDSPDLREDSVLAGDLQSMAVGLTGLPTNNVRPRWQAEPPKEPAIDVDWCAIGVVNESPAINPSVVHDGANGGTDTMTRQERLTVVATFYGPRANSNAKLLRDGIWLAQNRDMLRRTGLVLRSAEGPTRSPELVNTRWRDRADVTLELERMATRVYPVRNIASAPITINGAQPAPQSFIVSEE